MMFCDLDFIPPVSIACAAELHTLLFAAVSGRPFVCIAAGVGFLPTPWTGSTYPH
jgi:hypothetical protein